MKKLFLILILILLSTHSFAKEENEFPIKFKEKYINYQIPYKNWDEFFAPKK